MNRARIEEIIRIAEDWDLDALEVEDKDGRVNVVRRNAAAPSSPPVVSPSQPATQTTARDSTVPDGLHSVCSPMIGVFLALSPDTGNILATKGQSVRKGEPLGFVEAMKMQMEIVADVDGEIVEILAADQQAVEFGQPLFLVRPTSDTE